MHTQCSTQLKLVYFESTQPYSRIDREVLLTQLKDCADSVSHLNCQVGYFLVVSEELTEHSIERLSILLEARVASWPAVSESEGVWVLPRRGMRSPWSSRSTDIALHCQCSEVISIERGLFFKCPELMPLSAQSCTVQSCFFDPLVEELYLSEEALLSFFQQVSPEEPEHVDMLTYGKDALAEASKEWGLGLDETQLSYLYHAYKKMKKNPTDVELMMFAQVNSEHCRHKVFNASWTIDGEEYDETLFQMIRDTQAKNPDQALVAYRDNSAVLKGYAADVFAGDPGHHHYVRYSEDRHTVLKVETHNHPTAIAPHPGAATGSGGEIRDEAATGRGSWAQAGCVGYSVSHLEIPGWPQSWEVPIARSPMQATSFEIMRDAPIGAARFNNEFGRPAICGYFRNFAMSFSGQFGPVWRGYHKPIMIAGGIGMIRPMHVEKNELPVGALLIVLGGPGLPIGLGGGSASSQQAGSQDSRLDWASVQRANPEMERRAQEVITHCVSLGDDNPILSIHDVGAGGLSNALPELVVDTKGRGAVCHLNQIHNDAMMSPKEVWCNESQERFVLALLPEHVDLFSRMCERENCPYSVVGHVTDDGRFRLIDQEEEVRSPVDLPLSVLFDDLPQMTRVARTTSSVFQLFQYQHLDLGDSILKVLRFPAVASKSFLITIGDRSVGGLVSRDQMVGPWQVPVADVGVTNRDFYGVTGQAIAMGERSPVAVIHPEASVRLAAVEALTNLSAAFFEDPSQITLSANWMAAVNYPGEDTGLYRGVRALRELCLSLGIAVPVGKDSLSMTTVWSEGDVEQKVTSPLSLVVTATAPVRDVRRTLTPVLRYTDGSVDTQLLLIDLGGGCQFLGASVVAQSDGQLGTKPPDVNSPKQVLSFLKVIQELNAADLILSYHDRSDGGLLVTICEMMFASHVGVSLELTGHKNTNIWKRLFTEEIGAVIQVKADQVDEVRRLFAAHDLADQVFLVGTLNDRDQLSVQYNGALVYEEQRVVLQKVWSETSYRMQSLRDDPACAEQEYKSLDQDTPGLIQSVKFSGLQWPIESTDRPLVAILREQGVNGHVEMAQAFDRVGFDCVDVHMNDLSARQVSLDPFKGLVVCGGFSFGDVLQAGRGWAYRILMQPELRASFESFFHRPDTFTLGVCNGCQVLSYLQELIPGATDWPRFQANQSQQFESRSVNVLMPESSSIFCRGMAGTVLPIVVAHGEGQVTYPSVEAMKRTVSRRQVMMEYVDHRGRRTERYPENPNGSRYGITGLCSEEGRVTLCMPHPERVVRTVQCSWHPAEQSAIDTWPEDSPWIEFFRNARRWVG